MGRKITAVEACERGLVTDVFPESEFSREVGKRIAEMGALPTKVMSKAKFPEDRALLNFIFFYARHMIQMLAILEDVMAFWSFILKAGNFRVWNINLI